jgi:hypothetical protein
LDINTNISSNNGKNNYNFNDKDKAKDKNKDRDIESYKEISSINEKIKENYFGNLTNLKETVDKIEFKKQIFSNFINLPNFNRKENLNTNKENINENKENKENKENYNDNQYLNSNLKTFLPSEIKINKIKIASNLKGCYFRHKLKKSILESMEKFYKINLKDNQKISNKFLFKIANMINIEKNYNIFDKNSWKKTYSTEEEFKEAKMIYEIPDIDIPYFNEQEYSKFITIGEINNGKDNFFCKGILNENKELEGYGILIQGNQKYEGIFKNNKLNGWGRIIFSNDFMKEGIYNI